MVSTLVSNALFFGAALAILFVLSFIFSRQTRRILGAGLYTANTSDRDGLQKVLTRKTSRVIVLLTTILSLGLIAAGTLCTLYDVAAAPRVWAWFAASFLVDRVALAWLLGELLGLLLIVLYVRNGLRYLVRLGIDRLRRNPAFAQHGEGLTLLRARVDVLLRWGMIIAAITAASVLLNLPQAFNDPLLVFTYVVLAALTARALVVVASLAVDIFVQLVRTLEDKPGPLRYFGRLGRLEHLASVTKRTLEYFVFVGAATFVVHQLRPGTWLADTGLLAIRLIAIVYVGRVVVEVVGLVLREVLLADADRRTESEHQQRLTLVPIASSVLRYVVYFCMFIMALEELGVETAPILAGAGILGLAVGLGAQTFVGDVVAGFFILFEGMFLVGDRVRVGDVVGNVEEIGVRVLKVRDEFGVLHCIPNGEVRSVANHARGYVNAVVDFGLPYDEDIPGVLDNLRTTLAELREEHTDILADPEFAVQELLEHAVLIRSLVRVKPGRDDAVAEVIRTAVLSALTALEVTPHACHVVKFTHGARAPQTLPVPQTLPEGA